MRDTLDDTEYPRNTDDLKNRMNYASITQRITGRGINDEVHQCRMIALK